MSIKKLITIGISILFSTSFCSISFANTTIKSFDQAKLQQILTHYLQQHRNAEHISAIQASVQVPWQKRLINSTVGTTTWNGNMPTTDGNLFFWGSITKTFTAAVILNLVANHQLKLNQTLDDFFPYAFKSNQWPTAWKNVTVNQLLTMTSGIPDYLNVLTWDKKALTQHWSKAQLVNLLAHFQQTHACNAKIGCHPPGKMYHYSNTNFVLLAMIAEKVTGKPFKPLLTGMLPDKLSYPDAKVYYVPEQLPLDIQHQLVTGYFHEQTISLHLPDNSNVTNFNLSAPNAAGGLVGNTIAMNHLIQQLFIGNLLSPAAKALLKNNGYVSTVNGKPIGNRFSNCENHACYGNGTFMYYDSKMGKQWLYEGEYLGYRSLYIINPKLGIVITLSINSGVSDQNDRLMSLANAIMTSILKSTKLSS